PGPFRIRQSPTTELSLLSLLPSSSYRLSICPSFPSIYLLCLISIAIPPFSLASPPICTPQVHFGSPNPSRPLPRMFEDSYACVEQIKSMGGSENSSLTPWNPCKAETMDIKISSHILLPSPHDNFFPFARLNISVTVFDRTVADAVFLRLECLEAASGEDTYCHSLPPSHIAKYGRTIWPCRGASVGKEETSPFSLSFDCFHLFPNSVYHVNVTAFPSGCSSTLTVTIPALKEAYPLLSKFYNHQNKDKDLGSFPWAPMLLVDMTASEDGVWLRASIPSGAEWRVIELRLYKVNDGGGAGLIPHKEFHLSNDGNGSETGVKWVDADRGQYVLMGFIPRHDCSLHCESSSPVCSPCSYTRLPFHLERDYWTEGTAVLRRTKDVGVWVLPLCLGLVAACCLIAALYVRHVRRAAAKRTRDIPLTDRPLTLLLYSDDCEEHSRVVRELASVLESYAHVAFDQEDLLTNASLIPFDWLARSLAAAVKIVVVISPSTPILLQRERQLRPRRPYPDMLQPALKEISRDLCKPISRVAFVRLSYSPPLPDEFGMLGGKCFDLPSELPRLVSFIHGMHTEETKEYSMAGRETNSLESLREAIVEMERWMEGAGEEWLEKRLEPIGSGSTAFDTERIELRGATMPIENREVEGLLPADEDEEEEGEGGETTGASLLSRNPSAAPRVHELLPPDSDSSDD
ncbi:hypothetical protein PMAYCL1PPCAC_06303, partial [Pristionchus mayeri]